MTAPDLTRDAVIALCRAANWPVSDGERGEPCEFAGHPAMRVIAELDGLRVGRMGIRPGQTSGELAFGYRSAEHDDPRVAEWETLLSVRLVNIAEVDSGHAAMFMDGTGACYWNSIVHDAFAFMGDSLLEALEGFLVNRWLKAMLRPDQASVSMYGVNVTEGHPNVYDWRSRSALRAAR